MFYNHFYYSDRETRVTTISEILTSPDGTEFVKDTGEIYQKTGTRLLKKVQFLWSREDLDKLYLSKEDDDAFDGTLYPFGDNVHDFGRNDKRLAKIFAVSFEGTSTSAKYADVAEKYTSDKKYQFGTVVQISKGSKEITIFSGDTLAGVISKNPAYMLNSEIEGEYVVLSGQSPVICKGAVKKGQFCIAQSGGYVIGVDKNALTFEQLKDKVGVAISDSANNYVLTKM